jgi:hypothetical protein
VRPAPLPFDSLDPPVAATGVRLDAWRGLKVVTVKFGPAARAQAPAGEQGAGDHPADLHDEHYPHLVSIPK